MVPIRDEGADLIRAASLTCQDSDVAEKAVFFFFLTLSGSFRRLLDCGSYY